MKPTPRKLEITVAGALIAAAVGIVGVPWVREWHRERELQIVYEEVVRKLRVPHHNEEGYWVGDIAELHRLGQISREMAEADTAPLNPLVPTPVPFHGYFVRALVSGPPRFSHIEEPESFQGRKRVPDNFAICIYPAEPGPRKSAWIWSPVGQLRKEDGIPPAGFAFPPKFRLGWGQVQ